jgi:hypothetical protein
LFLGFTNFPPRPPHNGMPPKQAGDNHLKEPHPVILPVQVGEFMEQQGGSLLLGQAAK